MSRIASRKPIDDLELNLSAFANKLPTHWQAKQSNRRGESSVVRKEDMMRFYVSEDVENDVRRCITSWEHQHSISVTGRTEAGELKCFSGTVEAVARAPGLATGELWLVTMRGRLIHLKGRELAAMVPACDAGPAIRIHPMTRTIRS
jgi:hypothetical protein